MVMLTIDMMYRPENSIERLFTVTFGGLGTGLLVYGSTVVVQIAMTWRGAELEAARRVRAMGAFPGTSHPFHFQIPTPRRCRRAETLPSPIRVPLHMLPAHQHPLPFVNSHQTRRLPGWMEATMLLELHLVAPPRAALPGATQRSKEKREEGSALKLTYILR